MDAAATSLVLADDVWHFLGSNTIMIEYKAECGHVLEARDEDAGKNVRCSICGRTSTVPKTDTGGLDNLFDKVEQREPTTDPKKLRRRRDKSLARPRAPRPRNAGQLGPVAVFLRLFYAATLIAIVYYVGKFYVAPLVSRQAPLRSVATHSPDDEAGGERDLESSQLPTAETGFGLLHRPEGRGLYVASVPSGADVYCVKALDAPPRGRIRDVDGCVTGRATGRRIAVSADGEYVVEIAIPWNDPGWNSPDLPYYADFLAFRREIEHASEERQRELLESFFIPDDAWAVFLDRSEEPFHIVRQYRNVEIRQGRSNGVRALFLPWIRSEASDAIDVQALLAHYIPAGIRYHFDASLVQTELAYYDVPGTQQQFVHDALQRIGVIPFMTPDRRIRLFKIGIDDGAFAAPVVREAEP